jgi:hypothetical protein
MLETPTLDSLIVKNPELHSGRPTIVGTGITVRAIVGLYKCQANRFQHSRISHLSILPHFFVVGVQPQVLARA